MKNLRGWSKYKWFYYSLSITFYNTQYIFKKYSIAIRILKFQLPKTQKMIQWKLSKSILSINMQSNLSLLSNLWERISSPFALHDLLIC
jgi:hypothetical protein